MKKILLSFDLKLQVVFGEAFEDTGLSFMFDKTQNIA